MSTLDQEFLNKGLLILCWYAKKADEVPMDVQVLVMTKIIWHQEDYAGKEGNIL